jgi:uncharacterized protein YbjT (DUF2867 family)
MLALTGTTGKIGGAVLHAILEQNLIPPSELVLCTSSNPTDQRFDALRARGATVRQSNYDDLESMSKAFAGCEKLFLVSTPRIAMDYNDAPYGQGREKHHFAAIRAATEAGVKHIYYTSLAFGSESKAGVMRAHLRTEGALKNMKGVKYTIIREGLYNESWGLYFGYYNSKGDDRKEVVVAGDGKISWTSITDLGLGTALIVADPSTKYEEKTLYLSSSKAYTLQDIAEMVSKVKRKDVFLKIVPRDEYIQYYTNSGKERASVEWWSSSYAALEAGECKIEDKSLSELLSSKGRVAKDVEETIRDVLSA